MDVGTIIVTSIGAVVALSSAVFVLIKGRGENKNKADEIKLALDKKIDERVDQKLSEAYAELDVRTANLDDARRKVEASGRVIAAVAAQWPTDAPMPNIDPEDIRILEDTFPRIWRRPRPTPRGATP